MNFGFMEHFEPIRGIDYCDMLGLVATAGYDGRVILWDSREGKPTYVMNHDHLVNHCSFSSCGSYLVSSSSDYTARVWCTSTGRLIKVFSDHNDDVIMSKFSEDAEKVATASFDGSIIIYNTNDFDRLIKIETNSGIIECIAWSSDSRYIYSSGMDNSVKRHNMHGDEEGFYSPKNNFDIDCIVHSRFLDAVIIGVDDGSIRVLSNDLSMVLKKINIHRSGIKNIVIHKNDNYILTIGYDNIVSILDLRDFSIISQSECPKIIWARSVVFGEDNLVFFGTFGSSYCTWNFKENIWDDRNIKPSISINNACIYDKSIYTVGDAGVIKKDNFPIFNLNVLCNDIIVHDKFCYVATHYGELIRIEKNFLNHDVVLKISDPINSILLFENLLISSDYSGNLHFFDTENNNYYSEFITEGAIKSIKYYGERKLLIATSSGKILLYDLDTKISSEKNSLHTSILNDVAVHSSIFITVSRDLSIVFWSSENKEPIKIISRLPNSLKSVSISDDGTYCAIGSYRGHVDILNIKKLEWINKPLRPTTFGISKIIWNPEYKEFVAFSYDGNYYHLKPEGCNS